MPSRAQKTGCLGLLAKLFGAKLSSPQAVDQPVPPPLPPPIPPYPNDGRAPSNADQPLPYGKRDEFLSAAEISFYHVLKGLLDCRHSLNCKIRLGDLVYVKRPHENRGAINRINRKHVDFVICRADTMEPMLCIELDDKSHHRQDRRERDKLVDAVFEAAGLPLLHIPAARGYVPGDVAAKIAAAMGARA